MNTHATNRPVLLCIVICSVYRAEELLGGCSCLLFGDWGQLPPVMDLPLYTTVSRTALSDLGSTNYHLFDRAVVLDQVMRQAGQNADQEVFRNLLLRLRNAESTVEDWRHLMARTPAQVGDVSPFHDALHLHPTTEAVSNHNVAKLRASGQPIAVIKAVHTGPSASKASVDDAGGLEPVVCVAHGARVMLCSNLWVDVGLVNGAIGTVAAICYESDHSPPDLPVAVMVRFDNYSGPTLPDGTVPITPLRRMWFATSKPCSRLQLPLKLAWAVTIHKAQGMTLDKAVVDLGKKEFSTGLTFVACSRVRRLSDLVFTAPFTYGRVANLAKSSRLQERLCEDARLRGMAMPKEVAQPNQCSAPLLLETEASLPGSAAVEPPSDADEIQNASLPMSSEIPPPPDAVDEAPITGVDRNVWNYVYFPVDEQWQRRTCQNLGLDFIRPNGVAPGGPGLHLELPARIVRINGDGNCLFRAFSRFVTGSETQHMSVRRAILRHMAQVAHLLTQSLMRQTSIDAYVRETEMHKLGTWGTDVEIYTFAHLLRTCIYVYSVAHSRWQRHVPTINICVAQPTAVYDDQMALYVRHNVNHYEVVGSIVESSTRHS